MLFFRYVYVCRCVNRQDQSTTDTVSCTRSFKQLSFIKFTYDISVNMKIFYFVIDFGGLGIYTIQCPNSDKSYGKAQKNCRLNVLNLIS